jgi:hypothetical protein
VDPDYEALDLATGDIVFEKTGEEQADWTEVAIVIRPEDLGASGLMRPIVLTSGAEIGELGAALRTPDEDLVIVAGQHERFAEVLADLRDVILTRAEPADETGAAFIDELGGQPGPITRGAGLRSPLRGFTTHLAGAAQESAMSLRRCPFGDPMPCRHSMGQPR